MNAEERKAFRKSFHRLNAYILWDTAKMVFPCLVLTAVVTLALYFLVPAVTGQPLF